MFASVKAFKQFICIRVPQIYVSPTGTSNRWIQAWWTDWGNLTLSWRQKTKKPKTPPMRRVLTGDFIAHAYLFGPGLISSTVNRDQKTIKVKRRKGKPKKLSAFYKHLLPVWRLSMLPIKTPLPLLRFVFFVNLVIKSFWKCTWKMLNDICLQCGYKCNTVFQLTPKSWIFTQTDGLHDKHLQ